MKKLLAAMLLILPAAAGAHEVWIERDGNGPARIYLGEPARPLPPGGDPEFDKLQAPKLLPASSAPRRRAAGYVEVAVPPGDVRAWDDAVFAPWGEPGKKEGIVFYARAGRAETRAALPFEFAPTAAGGDRFVLLREGKPVPGQEVTVVTPDKWTRVVTTDAAGTVALPVREKGRYLLTAAAKVAGVHATPAGPVTLLHRVTTISFVVP